MNKTSIEWTTFTANPIKYRRKSDGKPVWACVKTSPGCARCYSEALAFRYDRGKVFNAQSMEELEPFLDEKELKHMRTAKTIAGVPVSGSRCFVGDMTDMFGEWIPDDLLNRLFSSVFEMRQDVEWQILTKRADRLQKYLSWRWGDGRIACHNITVGVSVENQQYADERIPLLLQTPAAVRFLSVEPMLGPVELRPWLFGAHRPFQSNPSLIRGPRIDWVIVGSESGRERRPMQQEWAESLAGQCKAAGVPFFMKQMAVAGKVAGDLGMFPESLRVREYPKAVRP